jgi:hypothetical protein
MLEAVLPPPTPQPGAAPAPSERLRVAWQQRHETDYVFAFPTAFGWWVLTVGVYGFYVQYQLLRRSREHNRRRFELLDAGAAFAWEQAQTRGLTEELRPTFERIAERLRVLNDLNAEFRDPALWVVLMVVTLGLAQFVAWILIDGDLTRHDAAERAIEIDVAAIYARLGQHIAPPDAAPVRRHQRAAARLVATVASLGIYAIWWTRDLMNDGNAHFEENWRFEDDLAEASQSLMGS